MGHQKFAIARVRCRRWWPESEQYEWPQEKAVLGCFESKDGGQLESTMGEDQGDKKKDKVQRWIRFLRKPSDLP